MTTGLWTIAYDSRVESTPTQATLGNDNDFNVGDNVTLHDVHARTSRTAVITAIRRSDGSAGARPTITLSRSH